MAVPKTSGIRSRVVMADSEPTVTATLTVTCSTMMAWADACPFEPTFTAGGGVASSPVIPARYWPFCVPAGTCTLKRTTSLVPAASVRSPGRPVTQQPTPEHPWGVWLKELPPLAAVPPVERLSLSFSAVGP